MASRGKKAAKAVPFNAADLSNFIKANPYIHRLMEDSDLRGNIGAALNSSKNAYQRLTGSNAPQKVVLEDKQFQKSVKQAAEAIRDASMALNEAPQKRKRHLGRYLLLLVLGAAVALAVSESLRSKVLDTLFGSEEEFQYTPPAGTPAPQPPSSPVSAA